MARGAAEGVTKRPEGWEIMSGIPPRRLVIVMWENGMYAKVGEPGNRIHADSASSSSSAGSRNPSAAALQVAEGLLTSSFEQGKVSLSFAWRSHRNHTATKWARRHESRLGFGVLYKVQTSAGTYRST